MKIILLQDVAKIGKRGQVTDVPDGYARNQLIPKKMAEPATPANLKRAQKLQAVSAEQDASAQAAFEAVGEKLTNTKVVIAAEANEQEHLFKAVSPQDIAEAAEAVGIQVDPALIVVGEPIKSLGDHAVQLVRGDAAIAFTIEVAKK